MHFRTLTLFAVGILSLAAGCSHSDRPHEYGLDRPPVDELDERDSGLQSKDVVVATDQMIQEMLADPEINASRTQWTIVVDQFEDHTSDRSVNYDIFLERLRGSISKYGKGRIRLIENKARFHDLRSKELESERDDFEQGDGSGAPAPKVVQPDYALYGKAMDMPNRATNYYLLQFQLTDLRTREQVWTGQYEVKVAR